MPSTTACCWHLRY